MISNGDKQRERSETLATRAKSEGCVVLSEGRWHYIAVKKLSALLRGTTSKHYGDFYCLNCFHFFRNRKQTSIA